MTVEFEGGALGVVSSTGNVPVGDAGQLDVRAYCEHGYVLLDAIAGALEIHRRDGSIERDQLSAGRYLPSLRDSPPTWWTCAWAASPTVRLPSSGIVPLKLLDAAYRSAANDGRMVEVSNLYA